MGRKRKCTWTGEAEGQLNPAVFGGGGKNIQNAAAPTMSSSKIPISEKQMKKMLYILFYKA